MRSSSRPSVWFPTFVAAVLALAPAGARAEEATVARAGVNSIGGWTLVSAGVAAALVGGALWAESESAQAKIQCTDPTGCGSQADRVLLAGHAVNLRNGAIAAWVIGGVVASLSALPFALEPSHEGPAKDPVVVTVAPSLAPGNAGLLVSGRF